jgi:membrane protease YdiL (CAAX protease family)
MAAESKHLISQIASEGHSVSARAAASRRTRALGLSDAMQVGVVFALILVAVWTPPGRGSRPGSGATVILVSGIFLIVAIIFAGWVLHDLGPAQPVPWRRAWKYAIWALEQEFILQSFFFVRLESLLGSRRAVMAAALLFAATHVPSPLLTGLSLIGGLLFCEMFRRYRNIFPLGLIHAAIGLTIAASLPDSLLHHMRVGLGYLLYRP